MRVTGVVQGVGFRPFVHRLALRHGLSGGVRNVAGAVEIQVEGAAEALEEFQAGLRLDAPPLSHIDGLESRAAGVSGVSGFRIEASRDAEGDRPVPADVAICPQCEAELFDPDNRRCRHPFITCTDCGPRYTIIQSLPYDRERTSMAPFVPCEECRREYDTPSDRRHHAETVSCHHCGPHVWFEEGTAGLRVSNAVAVRLAASAIRTGKIVAMRGIGGFHLACDATSDNAVRRLRERKHRDEKPFAVMVRTLDEARAIGRVSDAEAALLTGPERPVVLLERAMRSPIAPAVAPGLGSVGVMIAYTPLHHLLLRATARPLVMTSGNLSDEPIAALNDEARARLGAIADAYLLHDREIVARVDDSVVRVVDKAPLLLRRARGYAPLPIALPVASSRPLAAVGPHLKNTFTLVRSAQAFVSPHIGDLDGLEGLAHYRATFERYRELFRIAPEVAVRDLHPGYLSTRFAEEMGLSRIISVQHHHAHVAAVSAEHGVTTPVVGLAFDGTGLGDDGNVWGAEFLVADLTGYRRAAHLRYAPMPGGDLAAREPWRAALGYLSLDEDAARAFALATAGIRPDERLMAFRQISRGINAPMASSMGRLFDAAAAVLGVRTHSSYEGQAAMELEALAGSRPAAPLDFPVREEHARLVLDPLPLLAALGELRQQGVAVEGLAARFHESVVTAAAAVALRVADAAGLATVALGGGSFQNARLLSGVRLRLEEAGMRVLVPRQLGPNDGAISYGQAAVGAAILAGEG
ncbi:MAG: carbamoyltransferase HypF [Gemmatimonadales bacterium]